MVRLNVTSGDVELFNDSGALQWSGKPLGLAATVALPISGTNDAIVLLARTVRVAGPVQNLLRLSAGGAVMWRAELPRGQGYDSYVAVNWAGAQLQANTWSCYFVRLDADSGRIIDTIFTK
jgi:hypothetical protein